MTVNTGITGSANTGLSGRGAFFWLAALAILFFAVPMLLEKAAKKETQKAEAAKPVVRILKCDSGDESEYPWIGYGTSTLVVPPSDCWTEWQGIGNENRFSRRFVFMNDRPIERNYKYPGGKVRPLGLSRPFDDIIVGYPTAVQFRNSGKKEVRIRAAVK